MKARLRRIGSSAGALVGLALAVGCGESPPPGPVARPADPGAGHLADAGPTASRSPGESGKSGKSGGPYGSRTEGEGGPSLRENRLIARMLTKVSAARGLNASRPIPGVVLPRDELLAKVRAHVAVEVPQVAIQHEGLVLQLLGLVPTQFDYEQAMYALLQAQLAGFYEPAGGTMFMAADLDDEIAEATLAHELVHALQDQRWDLQTRSRYRPGQSDTSASVSALAEGDATSAMMDVLVGQAQKGKSALDLPDDALGALMEAGVAQAKGGAAGAPHVMQVSLVAPYVEGTRFVHGLRRKGGWPAVDRAWDHPPETTEQILHIEKWETHEPAMAVPAPTVAPLPAVAGVPFKAVEEDVFGELGARIAYAEWMDERSALKAAGHWGGDRTVLAQAGDVYALAVHLRFDGGEADAKVSYALLAKALRARAGSRGTAEGATFECVERADRGPLAVHRTRGELVLAVGPTRTGARWASASDCATVRTWTRTIADQK